MKEVRCKNCGSSSFHREDSFWICDYCGSRYEIDHQQDEKVEYLVMKAEDAFEKQKYGKMNECAMRILAIDPYHSYAWLMRMYFYGLRGETYCTRDMIEAGKKAVMYEREKIEYTKHRVYKAFTDWGRSGAFNAWSYIRTFQYGDLEKDEWKHPERIDSDRKKEAYRDWPTSAERQIDSAINALKEVPRSYFYPETDTTDRKGANLFNRKYVKEDYIKALNQCEDALERMKTCYETAGFDDSCFYTIRHCLEDMDGLWEKTGMERPSHQTVRIRMLNEDMKYRLKTEHVSV